MSQINMGYINKPNCERKVFDPLFSPISEFLHQQPTPAQLNGLVNNRKPLCSDKGQADRGE